MCWNRAVAWSRLLLSGFPSAGGFCFYFLCEAAGGSQSVAKAALEDTRHQSQVLAGVFVLTNTISQGVLWWHIGRAKSGNFLLQSPPRIFLHSMGTNAAAGRVRWLSG